MIVRNLLLAGLLACFAVQPCSAREPKESDKDLIYDEARVPGVRIYRPCWCRRRATPSPLRMSGSTSAARRSCRSSAICFTERCRRRVASKVTFDVVKTDNQFMNGLATRKDVRIRFEDAKGKAEMLILVFVPNDAPKPVPAFLMLSFDNTHGNNFDADRSRAGLLRNGVPIGEFLKRGFGFVAVYQQDLVGHNEVEFLGSIQRLFYREGQSFPKAYEWGVISAIAWSASRALDYLETDRDIDAARVAILGHSKCGKAALWAAAQDQRFALAISAESGHPGAALSRRKSGETLREDGHPLSLLAVSQRLEIRQQRRRSPRRSAHVTGLHRPAAAVCHERGVRPLGGPARRISLSLPCQRGSIACSAGRVDLGVLASRWPGDHCE